MSIPKDQDKEFLEDNYELVNILYRFRDVYKINFGELSFIAKFHERGLTGISVDIKNFHRVKNGPS